MYAELRNVWFPRLVYAALFLLPWQTRYIFEQKLINGAPFEYGKLSVYAVELLIIVAFFLGQKIQLLKLHRTPTRLIGVVLLAALVSVPFSIDPDLSFFSWTHLVSAALLFVCLLDRRVLPKRAMIAFASGLILPSLLGIFQVYSGTSPASSWLGLAAHQASDLGVAAIEGIAERFMRAYGTFSHPNIFGGYLTVGLLCTLMLARRRWITPLIPLFSFALILTFSRSAFLAFLAALFVGGGILLWKNRVRAREAIPVLGIVVFSLALSIGIFFDPLFTRLQPDLALEQRSISERIGQYHVFPRVLNGSIMTGVGLGAYTLALAEIEPDLPTWAYQPIHNAALLILGETGILGLIAVIVWAASIDRRNYAAIAKGSVGAIGGIALGTVLLVVTFLDHYLWSSWSGLALMAFVMAMTLRLSED